MKYSLLVFLFSSLFFISCLKEKMTDFSDNPISGETKILFHGPCDDFLNTSIDSCLFNKLDKIDGLEVDILLSRDKTIWLRHDDYVIDGTDTMFFNDLTDNILLRSFLLIYLITN